jgi:hypothetical protein
MASGIGMWRIIPRGMETISSRLVAEIVQQVASDKGVARVRSRVDSVAHDPASNRVRTVARPAGCHEPVGPGRSSGRARYRARPHAVLDRRRFRKVPGLEMAQPTRRRLSAGGI